MKFNSITLVKALLLCIAISALNNAQASLIETDYQTDNDNLAVYDEDTGLTWLDMTLTTSMGYEEAMNTYDGYRMATKEDVTELFNNYFGELSYNAQGIYYDYDETAVNYFIDLFGATEDTMLTSSDGFYLDGDILRVTSVGVWENADESNDGYLTDIYGTSYTANMSSFYENGANFSGFFLIKETATEVNEPQMLGLALLILFGLVTNKIRTTNYSI